MATIAATSKHPIIANVPARSTPYFTPAQSPPSGTAYKDQTDGKQIPKLFQPLTIRGVTFPNRIWLSPLCQYSAQDGHLTDWHVAHLGGIVSRGPGLTMVEATAVQANGRITPEDSGLWQDSQIAPLKRIVDFGHSQGHKMAIQLAHAGRKASTVAPWLNRGATAVAEVGGWPDDCVAPSAIAYNDKFPSPRELSQAEIIDFKQAYAAAVRRALQAGFDVIEIHNAHGYLLHEFLSPVSNKRTDEYGGSWENRTRLTLEVVDLVRAIIPKEMPLLLRISGTDCLEGQAEFPDSWTQADTVKLAPLLAERGVDLLDVSSGGNHPSQKIVPGPAYQSPLAKAVKAEVGDKLHVSTVGSVNDGVLAEKLLQEGLDVTFIGRGFQKNPAIVWQFAEDLGVEITVANQISWGFHGRVGPKKEKL